MVPSRLQWLDESKFPYVTRIEFIRSKLSNFSLMYPGPLTETMEHRTEFSYSYCQLLLCVR